MNNKFTDWWQEHKNEYQALLFDIDGTLLSAGKALPGAEALLELLRADKFPFFLLTNDGNHSTEEKSELMAKAGLHVAPDEIISCAMALEQFIEEWSCPGETFFVMGDLGVPCFAERVGLKVCRDPRKIEDCYGIIVGEGFYNWQDNISAAFNYLIKHQERPLVVPNPDSYWPGRVEGEFGIGAGAKARFVCGLLEEMDIKVNPVYLGKPYKVIYEYSVAVVKKRFGLSELDLNKVIMIGDSLKSDIRGANLCGMESALVMTGITDENQAADAQNEFKPDMIFKTLG